MPAPMPENPLKNVIKKTLNPKKPVPAGISLGMEEDVTRGAPSKVKKGAKPALVETYEDD